MTREVQYPRCGRTGALPSMRSPDGTITICRWPDCGYER